MRKIKKTITKDNLKKHDNLFVKDTISLDDKKNEKYFDNKYRFIYIVISHSTDYLKFDECSRNRNIEWFAIFRY